MVQEEEKEQADIQAWTADESGLTASVDDSNTSVSSAIASASLNGPKPATSMQPSEPSSEDQSVPASAAESLDDITIPSSRSQWARPRPRSTVSLVPKNNSNTNKKRFNRTYNITLPELKRKLKLYKPTNNTRKKVRANIARLKAMPKNSNAPPNLVEKYKNIPKDPVNRVKNYKNVLEDPENKFKKPKKAPLKGGSKRKTMKKK
jgi:hypothetical protein